MQPTSNENVPLKDEVLGDTPTTGKNLTKGAGDFMRFASIVIIVVIGIRFFIAQPFIVSGASMVPNFANNDYLIVDEISYRFHAPHRGDVIVFHPPMDPKTYYIKRIIGLPGDTVSVISGVVTITNKDNPNGWVLNEPYITKDTLIDNVKKTVPDGEYFVMGDNRPESYDSRSWGLLPASKITGRAVLRLFPVNSFTVLPGEEKIEAPASK